MLLDGAASSVFYHSIFSLSSVSLSLKHTYTHIHTLILFRYETNRIIGNLLSMGDPKLPVVGSPVKEMLGELSGVIRRDYIVIVFIALYFLLLSHSSTQR